MTRVVLVAGVHRDALLSMHMSRCHGDRFGRPVDRIAGGA